MKTNRPWASSITGALENAKVNLNGLDQVHKLARNYVASLDLGCPNLSMVNEVDENTFIAKLDGRERYLLWVKNWKLFYKGLSVLIRVYKDKGYQGQDKTLGRLKETAQVMLNARYNGKVASWAIKQRAFSNSK